MSECVCFEIVFFFARVNVCKHTLRRRTRVRVHTYTHTCMDIFWLHTRCFSCHKVVPLLALHSSQIWDESSWTVSSFFQTVCHFQHWCILTTYWKCPLTQDATLLPHERMLKVTHTTQRRLNNFHVVAHKSVKGRETRGHKRRGNFMIWKAPLHQWTYNKQIPKECLIYRVWAPIRRILSCHCAQQGKSISPSCIWRGFYLFWSSLHQAGVKIGVCFFLRCTWFHRLRKKMVQKKQFNILSGQTQHQALLKWWNIKKKKKRSKIVWPSLRQTQHRRDQGRV